MFGSTNQGVADNSFLLRLRRYRKVLFTTAALVFILTVGYVVLVQEHGFADVTVQIFNEPLVYSTETQEVYRRIMESESMSERQRLFLFSDRMFQHLISKFNLYDHYGIDPSSDDAFAIAQREITERLNYDYRIRGIIIITYTDRDNRLASDLLNEMMKKLDELNREEINRVVKSNARAYHNAGEGLLTAIERKQEVIEKTLNTYVTLESLPLRNDRQTLATMQSQLSLNQMMYELAGLKHRYNETLENKRVANENAESQLPIVNILARPMPDSDNVWLIASAYGMLIAAVVLILMMLGLYYANYFSEELMLLFGKDPLNSNPPSSSR